MSVNRIIIASVTYAALITLALLLIGYSLITIRKRFSLIFTILIRLLYAPVIVRALYPGLGSYPPGLGSDHDMVLNNKTIRLF